MTKKLVCKNNIVDSVKDYTPNQIKLFYGMLYELRNNVEYRDIDTNEEMEMDLQDIKKLIKDSKMSQNRISEMIYNMPNEIKFIDENKLTRVSVFEYIRYNFEDELLAFKPTETFSNMFLEVIKKYTLIELEEITKLNSKYSQRLYELSRRYLKQHDYLMKINDFKTYFKIPKSYKMGNIDQIILNPSIKELNKKTNITCKITKKKKGRKISHILFNFKEKEC